MRAKYFAVLAIFLGAPLIPAEPALAAPVVTFHVPLKLENLPPEIVKASVRCYVLRKDELVLGVNSVQVPIIGGQYSGPPVAVPVDLGLPAYAADAVGWKCWLLLVTPNGVEGVPAYNAATTMFKAKDGTPLVIETKGTF